MPECDHCEAEFEGEDAYLDHLAAEHEGELTRIERRRIENRSSEGDGVSRTALYVGGLAVVAIVALAAVFVVGGGGGDGSIESAALDERGDPQALSDVEQFPSRGGGHVAEGSQIDYPQFPPLSGTHYPQSASAGFYEKTVPLGNLVHSLEHGAVVIYYDPAALTSETKQSLQQFAQAHTDPWESVIVVPNPNEDPQAKFVLTAWQHRLTMDQYDPQVVFEFLSQHLGRGPENRGPNRGRSPPG